MKRYILTLFDYIYRNMTLLKIHCLSSLQTMLMDLMSMDRSIKNMLAIIARMLICVVLWVSMNTLAGQVTRTKMAMVSLITLYVSYVQFILDFANPIFATIAPYCGIGCGLE